MTLLFVESLESRRLLAAGYQIQLNFESSVSASVRTVIQNAANKWQSIITGDVPDVGAGAWGAAVDDIRITARVKSIDGAGKGLAQARPTYIRTNKLPIAGEIEIDSADVGNSALSGFVTHEIAHALGFGTIWSQFPSLRSGVGGSNPLFLGANALREYRNYAHNTALTGVPLENTGVAGTRDVHWRETTFGNELLTGFIGAGSNPISRVTIGQFADLGYQVNYNAADSYTLPGVTPPPAAKGSIGGRVYNDVNRNAAIDAGDVGVAGKTVYIDVNKNGVKDTGDVSSVTDSTGRYNFPNLSAGTYYIRLNRGTLTQLSPSNNGARVVNLGAGSVLTSQNFGTSGGVAGISAPAMVAEPTSASWSGFDIGSAITLPTGTANESSHRSQAKREETFLFI